VKTIKVVIIVLSAAWLVNWMNGGSSVVFPRLFPFLGGFKDGHKYEVGALFILIILVGGLWRLSRWGEGDG